MSDSSMRVVVDTRLRRERRRLERAEADGEADVERRRVGESRIRWIFRWGYLARRVEMVFESVVYVEAREESLRWLVFVG